MVKGLGKLEVFFKFNQNNIHGKYVCFICMCVCGIPIVWQHYYYIAIHWKYAQPRIHTHTTTSYIYIWLGKFVIISYHVCTLHLKLFIKYLYNKNKFLIYFLTKNNVKTFRYTQYRDTVQMDAQKNIYVYASI